MKEIGTEEGKPVDSPVGPDGSRAQVAPEESAGPVLPVEEVQDLAAATLEPAAPPLGEQPQVHVAPNLIDLTIGRAETPEEKREAQEQRDINEIVHRTLVLGLAVSTTLMLIGIALEIIRRQSLPTVEPAAGDILSRVMALRPSGFLALGLLVLLGTPILRVIGSVFAFAYERDWRFAGITFLVLMVVIASILLGNG